MDKIRFYSVYKNLWYKYVPETNIWEIADNKYGSMYLWKYNANSYRIDQCFDDVFKYIKQENMNLMWNGENSGGILWDRIYKNSDYILDWNLDSGQLWLNENNIEYRISFVDGNARALSRDYKPERVNLEIEKGKIIKITYG